MGTRVVNEPNSCEQMSARLDKGSSLESRVRQRSMLEFGS